MYGALISPDSGARLSADGAQTNNESPAKRGFSFLLGRAARNLTRGLVLSVNLGGFVFLGISNPFMTLSWHPTPNALRIDLCH